MKNIEFSDSYLGLHTQKIRFSIVFPTRERPDLLRSLLNSLVENTFNLESIEVLIAIDNDDKTDYEFIELYSFVKFFRVPQSLNFSENYYNFLASNTVGNWIITANDDCRFETKNWDIIAFDTLKDKSNVIYGWIEDGLGKFRAQGQGSYCCFPLQGRRGYEALKFIFPARIPTWGADIWAAALYKQISSSIILPITIKHYCHHNKTRIQDNVSMRISRNQVSYSTKPIRTEIEALLNALNGSIPTPIQPKERVQNSYQKTNMAKNLFINPHKRRLICSS